MSFAALALRARAANDTIWAQINNIPENSHVIPLIHTSEVPSKKQKVGKTELNYDTDDINFGKTGESFVFKE